MIVLTELEIKEYQKIILLRMKNEVAVVRDELSHQDLIHFPTPSIKKLSYDDFKNTCVDVHEDSVSRLYDYYLFLRAMVSEQSCLWPLDLFLILDAEQANALFLKSDFHYVPLRIKKAVI